MPDDARRALLTRLFDHAPMFPPAAWRRRARSRRTARAQASAHAWMLGRFVVAGRAARSCDGRVALAVVGGQRAAGRRGLSRGRSARRGRGAWPSCEDPLRRERRSLGRGSGGVRSRLPRARAHLQGNRRPPPRLSDRRRRARVPQRARGGASSATRRRRSARARACVRARRGVVSLARRGSAAAASCRRARLAVPVDRDVLVLRAGRGAPSVGDPVSFGAGPNGLLWRDGDEAVDLSGLGDVFAQSLAESAHGRGSLDVGGGDFRRPRA